MQNSAHTEAQRLRAAKHVYTRLSQIAAETGRPWCWASHTFAICHFLANHQYCDIHTDIF